MLIVAVFAIAQPAFADDADSLTAQGEELARAGEYTRAIDLFKRADAIAPSAKRACLIGLVYTRRELWSQAEIFLDRCQERVTPSDPLPLWFAKARAQLAQKLSAVDVAELTVEVTPPSVAKSARVSVSTFAPDETFEARKIHLIPGTYVISAQAPGLPAGERDGHGEARCDDEGDVGARPDAAPQPPPIVVEEHASTSKLPRDLWIAAGALAIVGGAFHVAAYLQHNTLNDAAANDDPQSWDDHHGTFETERGVVIGCYSAAIVVAAIGIVLSSAHHDDTRAPVITGSIGSGTEMVGIELRR